MIDFQLTSEQEAIRDKARRFAEGEISPVAAQYDRTEAFPWEVARKAFEGGLMNLVVPRQFGGGGLGHLEEVLVCEELSAACAGITATIVTNHLSVIPLLLYGTYAQKERFLLPLCGKLSFAAFALTEPDAGSDVTAISTRAIPSSGGYILRGKKSFVTNGSVSDLYTVFATVDKAKGRSGLVTIMVPRSLPGVSVGKREEKMGQRACDCAELILEDVELPADNVVGQVGQGFEVAMRTLDSTRPLAAAVALGIARAALALAAGRASNNSMEKSQAIAFVIADMAKDLEAARLLTWYAAWLLDRGRPRPLISASAKCLASDLAMRASIQAVQIFGNSGARREEPVQKLLRDAKLTQINEGTNQIQRIVIAREVLRRARHG